jgi:hypothetical protein
MSRSRFVFVILIGAMLQCVSESRAYISSIPSYENMSRQAEWIVIATPIDRKELQTPALLPGVSQTSSGKSASVPAIRIHTTFQVTAALKGSLTPKDQFVLVHFRKLQKDEMLTAGPYLIDFKPKDGSQYLMFLKQRRDGYYEAYQEVEPGWCIEKLQLETNAKSAK